MHQTASKIDSDMYDRILMSCGRGIVSLEVEKIEK